MVAEGGCMVLMVLRVPHPPIETTKTQIPPTNLLSFSIYRKIRNVQKVFGEPGGTGGKGRARRDR